MAGKEPLRILAFALCAVSFALLSVAIYTDHWREIQTSSGFGTGTGKAFEGLWNNCWWDATGQTHCYPQPYSKNNRANQGNSFSGNSGSSISLPGRFYFYRGLTVIALLTNFVGLMFLMTGLKCIDITFERKIKMQMGAGFNAVAGICALATVILFKINEWQTGNNRSSSLGMGMYLLIGYVVLEVAAVALAVAGIESDDGDYEDENASFQPKGYNSQPGSIVNQPVNHGSSYI